MTQVRKRRPRDNATNPPYTSDELDKELNTLLAPSNDMSTYKDDPTIKTVAVVGALFDKDYNMFREDWRTVQKSLQLLRDAQISMTNNIKFLFYNLLAPIQSDFMAAAILDNCAPQADAVITCYLYGTRYGRITTSMLHPHQMKPYEDFSEIYTDCLSPRYSYNREISISHLQQEPGFWPRAADLVDAKFVITYGGKSDELNTDDFLMDDFYQAAIHTDEKGLPMHTEFGILVSNAHLAKIQTEANAAHVIGQRILALKPVTAPRAQVFFPEPA